MKILGFAVSLFLGLASRAQVEFAPVTREELSYAYMRFDSLLYENPQTPERMIEINKGFDAVTQKFFTFQLAAATRDLNELSLSLLPADADKDAYRIAWALATELSPADIRTDSPDAAILLRSMYAVTSPAPVSIFVELAPSDTPLLQLKPTLHTLKSDESAPIVLKLPLKDVIGARENLAVTLSFSPDERYETRRFLIPRTDPDFFSGPFARKLATLQAGEGKDAGYQRAQAICAERIKIYSGTHSSIRSAQYLLNPKVHDRQLYQELKLLTSGINPYRNRPGDIWRPIIPASSKSPPIPCRVYVPANLTGPASGSPLIIAFHGAGGDESMFMDAYGNGEIKRLADEFGFIVASPSTSALMANPAGLTDLVEQIAEDVRVDRTRIYIIGHSMGAGLASTIANKRAETIAATVCIAGGSFEATPGSKLTPTLVIGAQLDPIIPAARLEKSAAAAKAAGLPVEFRLAENQGHTLVVGTKLRESIEWALSHALKRK